MADSGDSDKSTDLNTANNTVDLQSTPSADKFQSILDNTQNEDEAESNENKTSSIPKGEVNQGDESDRIHSLSSNLNATLSLASTTTTTTTITTPQTAPETPNKIEILLKAVGNAPILKKKKFLLERTKNVHYIVEWLKKYMKLDSKEQLFLYVNQEFAPSPDAEIGTIYDCFKTGNNVIFHYCTTPAWG